MKLGLGTAQLGLNYGISNQYGKPSSKESREILATAADCGVRCLDTAPIYGSSEALIGESLPEPNPFLIVTKTPCFGRGEITPRDEDAIEVALRRSLARLRQPAVYGLLVHHTADLFLPGGDKIFARMKQLRSEGLVSKIGVSVYSGEQIDRVLRDFDIDLIQLPLNVFDQRLIANGCLTDLKRRGIEVHARSIFLQGALLMDPELLPPFFDSARSHIRQYRRELAERALTPLQAALRFAAGIPEIDLILCGAARPAELREIREALDAPCPLADFSRFALTDPAILNPSTWVL
jgi:aryl-alcohol dehydrogenase-like predicted oxidoreductase